MTTPPPFQPLRDAANALRDGAEITPEAREAVAALLDAEFVTRSEMRPFAEVINAAIEHKTGVKSYIRFSLTDEGQPSMELDTSDAALAVAAAVLAARPSPLTAQEVEP